MSPRSGSARASSHSAPHRRTELRHDPPLFQAQEQGRPTGSTSPQEDRNPRGRVIERVLYAPIEPSWCTRHSTTPSFTLLFTTAIDLIADSLPRRSSCCERGRHIFRHRERNVKRSDRVDALFTDILVEFLDRSRTLPGRNDDTTLS